ncbi:MAG: tRNA (guanosine(37)-N1)-methyltransferase TrmD [Paracoccaceae bacterium]|nr:tRNA (guanosine(37)-N1)-methyltransferase TrmD [Paracoccaceae bacterium]
MSDIPAKSHGRLAVRPSAAPRELMGDRPELAGAWEARVISLVPEVFPGVLGASLTGKALHQGLWRLTPIDLRAFGSGKHRNVDDTPAGGGAGMVLRADVMGRAIRFAMRGAPEDRARWPLVYLSPRGTPFDQATAELFSKADGVTLIAGRFEGLDERVIARFGVEEISLGDFVMTGGDVAAMAVIDAVVRLRPGVLGNAASTTEESFTGGLLEHPHYTRPAEWEGLTIPEVLTSGDHRAVERWRRAEAERVTRERRPDLWARRHDPQ